MTAKYQLMTELYRRTGIAVAKNPQAWQSFLAAACRNYKCRFDEQLLIYAQRPDAIAVAELDISQNSYAVRFDRFTAPPKQVMVYRVKGSLSDIKKIGGLRGLYLHYCYQLGILPKNKKQNYARLHYLLKDDLMKMEAIAKETRLLCRNHIDTAQQLLQKATRMSWTDTTKRFAISKSKAWI